MAVNVETFCNAVITVENEIFLEREHFGLMTKSDYTKALPFKERQFEIMWANTWIKCYNFGFVYHVCLGCSNTLSTVICNVSGHLPLICSYVFKAYVVRRARNLWHYKWTMYLDGQSFNWTLIVIIAGWLYSWCKKSPSCIPPHKTS